MYVYHNDYNSYNIRSVDHTKYVMNETKGTAQKHLSKQ